MRIRLNSFTTVTLAVVALAVWGHNAYKFLAGVKNADEPSTPLWTQVTPRVVPEVLVDSAAIRWLYEAKYRDPFENWLTAPSPRVPQKEPRKKPVSKPRKKPVPQPQLPSMRFLGVIEDEKGGLALVEDERSGIHFVKPGDQVSGVTIVAIDSAKLGCRFNGRGFTLNLQR